MKNVFFSLKNTSKSLNTITNFEKLMKRNNFSWFIFGRKYNFEWWQGSNFFYYVGIEYFILIK